MYQHSSVWYICITLLGQWHSSDQAYDAYISVCPTGQQLQGNTSAASDQLCIHVMHSGDNHLRWDAREHSQVLFESSKLPNTKVYARGYHPCLNTSKGARILTHTKTYIQALLKHASAYNGRLVRKLAHPLSYSEAFIHNRKIEHSYTCTDASMDTSIQKALLQTHTLACTHAWKHVILHQLTITA
jgi:hypothetical protein